MTDLDPNTLALGNFLVENGFTVAAPSMFGKPGVYSNGSVSVITLARACVSREFAAFATNAHRPATKYLQVLARDLNSRTPGAGVGAIGQCFTGGFALGSP